MDIYEELVRLRKAGQKCALATIIRARGSIPSHENAKLLIREDGSFVGTVGGGCVEAEVWNAAREVMEEERPRLLTFQLNHDVAYENGLICGGQVEIYIEPILPDPQAFIFGAGHVGRALSRVATLVGFKTIIIDDRESFANPERFPEAEAVYAGEYEQIIPQLNITSSSYIIVVTRGHRDDLRVLRAVLKTPARYIAMVGSKRKVIEIVRHLEREEAVRREELEDRLFAPMGLEIGAITPEEIAVSVVAEMIAVRRKAPPDWKQLSKSLFVNEALKPLLK